MQANVIILKPGRHSLFPHLILIAKKLVCNIFIDYFSVHSMSGISIFFFFIFLFRAYLSPLIGFIMLTHLCRLPQEIQFNPITNFFCYLKH